MLSNLSMWFPFSLLCAIFAGSSDVVVKNSLTSNRYQVLAWVRPGWSALFLFLFYHWAAVPADPWAFWKPVLIAAPLEMAAALIFSKALQTSPLSTTIPYMAFTPVFILISGWIFLGEKLSLQGITGILCVTIGAVTLQIGEKLQYEKGSMLVLLVSFIYSITAVLAKKAVLASSPLYFCTMYYGIVAVGLLPFVMGSKTWIKDIFGRPKVFGLIGLLDATALFLQFHAFDLGPVAYVVAIKRLSLLLSVFLGWMVFKEKHFFSRIVGAILMALGAILIGFTG